MQELLDDVLAEGRLAAREGRVADYIPALAAVDPGLVGLALVDAEGRLFASGEHGVPFTIQSVSKVLALAYVLERRGPETVFSRVGKEPTGDPFNSIIRLETSSFRKPFNPLINAGAIVVSSLLPGEDPEARIAGLLAFAAELAGRPDLAYDPAVYASERDTAARNRSIAWFLAELGLLERGVEDCLETYFRQCAILMDARDLARVGAVLALDGIEPGSGRRLLSARSARTVKSLMMTCGLYDGSGEFGVEAGIPAKSGVGGGILAAAKGRCGIAAFGPALDRRGNSAAGVRMLSLLSERLELFAL